MTDQELRQALKELDQDPDVDVSEWEVDFLESILSQRTERSLSEKQRAVAERMIDQYGN